MVFDQRSPQPLEEGVLQCHTHTYKKTDRWISRLYDCIGLGDDSVKTALPVERKKTSAGLKFVVSQLIKLEW